MPPGHIESVSAARKATATAREAFHEAEEAYGRALAKNTDMRSLAASWVRCRRSGRRTARSSSGSLRWFAGGVSASRLWRPGWLSSKRA